MLDQVDMNSQQVLYEAELSRAGRILSRAGWVVLVFWVGGGAVLCFRFDSFPGNLLPLAILVIGAAGFARQKARVMKLRRKPGSYTISINDYRFYVHSHRPASAPSFSVISSHLYRPVRKTIKYFHARHEHEYYL